MQNPPNTQFSATKFLKNRTLTRKYPAVYKLLLVLGLLSHGSIANAQNPYQEALRQQREIQEQQNRPVGPLGISPSQIELERNLEQELLIQEQKIQKLQSEIRRLKRKRDQNNEP